MKLGALVFAAILMALAPPASAQQKPSLKSAVIVEGQYIHLGDLFENAGKNAEAKIAYAPRPGRRAVFDAT